jgi:hypothetical protein
MTAVVAVNATDRSAETWKRHLAPFTRLEFAISDAAKGITAAVARLAQGRRDDPDAPILEHGLDVFHTTMEAKRVLAQTWRRTEAAWETAEAADLAVARSQRQGIDARGVAKTAFNAWSKAIASFEQAERLEAAWTRAHAALDLFDSSGHLHTRAHAEAEIALALKDLTGPEWSKVRHFLNDPRSLNFLDRMHRRLGSAEPRRDWREAMAWRWWLRYRRSSFADLLIRAVRAVGRDGALSEEERVSYGRVAAVLEDTFRASSAVECMNGVLRMQQSRHKRMSQPMLDLKRLYWNCHEFGSGPRKGISPYRRLGLDLPTFDFWPLLQADPTELTQELSTSQSTE